MSVDRQMAKIRVLIIAGIRLYCEGLAEILGRRARVEVVGVASDPVRGLQPERDLRPDVVVLDTSMPQAITAVHAILATTTPAKVIALGVSEEGQDVLAFAEAGVCGYVTRDATIDHLAAVIESVARGEVPCPQDSRRCSSSISACWQLTARRCPRDRA